MNHWFFRGMFPKFFSLLPAVLLLTRLDAAETSPSPLDQTWSKMEIQSPYLRSRDLIGFILEAAGSPGYERRSAQIAAALQDLEKMQDRNPASKTYGNFCWYWHEDKPGDLNAVEFVIQQAALLKLRYAGHLSSQLNASLDRLLILAVGGIQSQKVNVGYTNIYLMKAWNLLALGEVLKRPELSREGSGMLDQWIDFTSKNGISEYLSPTYYGVDLESLGLMARQLSNPPAQKKAEIILRLFWTDIAANWFDPAGRLGGAHGRDYDYLMGHGTLDQQLTEAGWINPPPSRTAAFHVFADAARWIPPEKLHQEALSDIPRFVFQKWGASATQWATQYMGHHFSLGVSGSSRGGEDKPFALNLAGPAGTRTVRVNFFMDGRGDAYGKNKIPHGASGHPKADHLVPFFAAVQSSTEVLFLASWPQNRLGAQKDGAVSSLQSHLDIPAEAVVWTQDKPVETTSLSQPLPGNICFLRLGDVAVGIRFILATDMAGHSVTAEIVNDGGAYQARRLSVVHSAGPPGPGVGTVALFVRAKEGLDEAGFAAFRRDFTASKTSAVSNQGIINLKAQGLKNELALEVDLRPGIVLHSVGADQAMQSPPMSVNGKEYALGILGQNASAGF